MKRAILIRPGGYVDPYTIGGAFRAIFELEQMQRAVGGDIQLIPHNIPNLSAFCNENGIAEELEYNQLASELFSYGFEGKHHLLGNVLVMGGVDEEGKAQGLTVEQVGIFLHTHGILDQLING